MKEFHTNAHHNSGVSSKKTTLGRTQRYVLAAGDMISSAYSTVFIVVLFVTIFRSGELTGVTTAPSWTPTIAPSTVTAGHLRNLLAQDEIYPLSRNDSSPTMAPTPSFQPDTQQVLLYYYLLVWMLLEGINLFSIWSQRLASLCFSLHVSQVKKYFVFRAISFLHNFVVICCTGGFLGEWVGEYSNFEYMVFLRIGLLLGQVILWILAIIFVLGCIALIGLRDPNLGGHHENLNPACFMLSFGAISLIGSIVNLFCKGCEPVFHCLFWPAEIAVFIALIPISFVVFSFFVVFHTFSWVFIVGTLLIPLGLAWCFLPQSAVKLITTTRKELYRDADFQYSPAIMYGGSMCDDKTPNYIKMIGTLGTCFDCVVLAVAWYVPVGLCCCGVACAIMYYVYPMSVESVSNRIIDFDWVSQLWIFSKVIQVIVAFAIPLLRLIANKKLQNLKSLFDLYVVLITDNLHLLIAKFLIYLIEEILKEHHSSEIDEVISEAKRKISQKTDSIRKLQIHVEEEMLRIAEEIFDFDFDQGVRLHDIEEITTPLM
jgi:hypothetical protein